MKLQQMFSTGMSQSSLLNIDKQHSHSSLAGTGLGNPGTLEKSQNVYLCAKMASISSEGYGSVESPMDSSFMESPGE
jgi:hypothetical protein